MESQESTYYVSTNKKDAGYYSILFIFLATAIQSCFGFSRSAPPLFKLLIAAMCWLSCIMAVMNNRTWKSSPQHVRFLFSMLVVDVIGSILHAIWSGTVFAGEKYVVLLTSVSFTLNVISLVYVFAITGFHHLRMILHGTLWLFALNALLLVFNFSVSISAYFLSYFMIYSAMFLPYIDRKKKLFFLAGIIMAMFAFLGGGRQILISLGFMILAWVLSNYLSHKLVLIVSLSLIILPIFSIWFWGNDIGDVFWLVESNVEDREALSGNTRTLLYQEVMTDFNQRDGVTQLFGQGTLAYYDSPSFKTDNRQAVEVPILQWIMQCGIVYYVLFTLLCVSAIMYIYIHGENRLMAIVSIMLGAFYFMCHVSNFTGCNTTHLGFWGMMGMAFNPLFLEASDDIIYDELA